MCTNILNTFTLLYFHFHFTDGASSTSYESYDEPEGEEPYNNVGYDGEVKTDIVLPRYHLRFLSVYMTALDACQQVFETRT